MSGTKDCHEFRFLIVRIVISVSNVTSLQDCLLKIVSLILPPREYEELSFKLSTCGIMWYQHSYSPTDSDSHALPSLSPQLDFRSVFNKKMKISLGYTVSLSFSMNASELLNTMIHRDLFILQWKAKSNRIKFKIAPEKFSISWFKTFLPLTNFIHFPNQGNPSASNSLPMF